MRNIVHSDPEKTIPLVEMMTGKQRPTAQTWLTTCFCKYCFVGTKTCSFFFFFNLHVMYGCVPATTAEVNSCSRDKSPAKPKIFTI